MDLNEQLLLTRLQSRIGELEHWLAMLIVAHGQRTQIGYQYLLSDKHAMTIRALIPGGVTAVSIDYDIAHAQHVLDVLA